jgi:hypothetical protein
MWQEGRIIAVLQTDWSPQPHGDSHNFFQGPITVEG